MVKENQMIKDKNKLFSKLAKITPKALDAIKKGVEENHSVSNLEQLGISQRLINLLESNKISNIKELMFIKKEDLVSIPNFGEKQLSVLFEALSNYHLLQIEK